MRKRIASLVALSGVVAALALGGMTSPGVIMSPPEVVSGDTLEWTVEWTEPEGASDIEGYNWEAGWSDSPGTALDVAERDGSVGPDTRQVVFRSPYSCGDTTYYQSRVRAFGSWSTGAPWGESAVFPFYCESTPPPEPTATIYDDFESGDLSYTADGIFSWGSHGGNVNVRHSSEMKDGATAHSGDHALEVYYRGPTDQISAELRFFIPEVDEFWWEMWIRFPTNYKHRDDPEHAADNNKFFRMWNEVYSAADGTEEAELGIGQSLWRSGETSKIYTIWEGLWQYSRYGVGEEELNPAVTDSQPGTFRRGEWVRYRIHVKPGQGDGVWESWTDGIQWMDLHNIEDLWDPYGDNTFKKGYIFGAANAGFEEDTYIYVDDWTFHTTDPGW